MQCPDDILCMYVSDFAGYVSVDVPVATHSPSPIFWKISGNAADAEYDYDVWTSTSLVTSIPILTIHFLCFNMYVAVQTLSGVSKHVVLTCMLLTYLDIACSASLVSMLLPVSKLLPSLPNAELPALNFVHPKCHIRLSYAPVRLELWAFGRCGDLQSWS